MTLVKWSGEAVRRDMREQIAFMVNFVGKLPPKGKKKRTFGYTIPETGRNMVLLRLKNKYVLHSMKSGRVSEYDLTGMPTNKHEILEVKCIWLNKLRPYALINGIEHVAIRM